MRRIVALVALMIFAFSCAAEETRIHELFTDCVSRLCELSCDREYIRRMTASDEIIAVLDGFREDARNGSAPARRLTDTDALLCAFGGDVNALSVAARENLNQRLFSAPFLAAQVASRMGVNALAATSLLNVCLPLDKDLPNALYYAPCENDTGVIMGIWNDGNGMALVTASFVPNVSALDAGLAALYQ